MSEELPIRVRFAKDQLLRALKAMEDMDPERLDESIRILDLEDQLEDAREQIGRWRRSYETAHSLLLAAGHPEAGQRDQEVREWVGSA